ncbi:MAG TPA: hypothetical protein VGK25_09210 [Ignavibacteria bacterium]|jgi:hypothetical protein
MLKIIIISFAAVYLSASAQAQWKLISGKDEVTSLNKLKTSTGFIGSINGGLEIPFGDLSDNSDLGWNIGATGGYVFNNQLATRVDLTYNSFVPSPFGRTFSVITFRGDFMFGNFGKKATLAYMFGGIGMYSVNIPSSNISVYNANGELISTVHIPSDSKAEFGIAIGGGIGFRISNDIAMFGEAAFCQGFGSKPDVSFIPFKAGIMLTP